MGYPRATRRAWTSRTALPVAPTVSEGPGEPMLIGSYLQVGLDVPQQLLLRAGPHHARLLLAAGEQDQGRNAQDAQSLGDFRVLVDVQLHDAQTPVVLARDLFEDGRHRAARSTP